LDVLEIVEKLRKINTISMLRAKANLDTKKPKKKKKNALEICNPAQIFFSLVE